MTATTRPTTRDRLVLGLLCGASFLAVVDTTIVNMALPTIRRAMNMTIPGSQWVLNSYALVFGGLLLLSGRLGDRSGRRRFFVLGLLGLAGGSVLAATAVQPFMLIIGRVIQGLSAAAFVPNSLSLLTSTFTQAGARSRALGAYGAMAGLGFVVGMVGGGTITELLGWRWVFWFNLPVVALLLAASRLLPAGRPAETGDRVDVVGAVALTVGLVLLIYALAAIPAHGLASGQTLVAGSAGVTALIFFVIFERWTRAPLVPPMVAADPAVSLPNTAIMVQSMIGVAWLFLLTQYLQDERGLSALASGLWFAPMTLSSVTAAALAGPVLIRIGRRAGSIVGQLLLVAGVVIIAAAVGNSGGFPVVIIGTVVGEAGFMVSSVAFTVAATSSIADAQAGLAAGLVNTATQLGGAIGLGVVASIAGLAAEPTSGIRFGFLACMAFSVVALVLAVRLREPV